MYSQRQNQVYSQSDRNVCPAVSETERARQFIKSARTKSHEDVFSGSQLLQGETGLERGDIF
jgi:hypothetical protein